MSIINRLFKSKEVKILFYELHKAEIEMNNESFEVVKRPIKDFIYNNSKTINEHMNKGESSIIFIYNIINTLSGEYFESGKFPYHGHFGIGFGEGYHLLNLFDESLNKLVELGVKTKENAEEQKQIIRQNMSHLISNNLPF